MAVTIREQPHPLDFAGNRPRFLLKGTPVATAGSKSRSAWRVNALPSSVLTVGFGDTVLDFQITSPYQARDRADRIAGYNDTSMLKKELPEIESANAFAHNYLFTADFAQNKSFFDVHGVLSF